VNKKEGESNVMTSTVQQARPVAESSLLGGAIAAGMLFWGPSYQNRKDQRKKEIGRGS
jgi:hypothetical protein